MPATEEVYGKLLSEVLPAVIETSAQYETISGRLSELVRKGRSRTPEETRLVRLLAILVRDYDQRMALPRRAWRPGKRSGSCWSTLGKRPPTCGPFSDSAVT